MRMLKSKLYVYYDNTSTPYRCLNSALNFDDSDDFFLVVSGDCVSWVAGNCVSEFMGDCVLLVAGDCVWIVSCWGSWTDCSSSSVNVVKWSWMYFRLQGYCPISTYSSRHASRSPLKRRDFRKVTRPKGFWRPWRTLYISSSQPKFG